MIDANLSFFCEAAKEIAPFFGKIFTEQTSSATKIIQPIAADSLDKPEEPVKSELSNASLLTSDVPALAPTQSLAIQTDLSIHNFSKPPLPEETSGPSIQPNSQS